jgi:hypothetical protein
MKPRRIYYRRKGSKIIIEGKERGKSVLIWTLPDPENLLLGISEKASFFTQEKALKISEKVKRLDFKDDKQKTDDSKVLIRTIKRTDEKDAVQENSEEKKQVTEKERAFLWEITK